MIDDDVPMADPKIRAEYEAALGAFILMFNEADFYLSQIIGWELERDSLSKRLSRLTEGSISTRIDTLHALSVRSKEPSTRILPFEQMRLLTAARNQLAHGYFEQNPFEGSYQIITKRKYLDYPATRVRGLTVELEQIVELLRSAYFSYFFEDMSGAVGE